MLKKTLILVLKASSVNKNKNGARPPETPVSFFLGVEGEGAYFTASMWDLRSPTRDHIHAACLGSVES